MKAPRLGGIEPGSRPLRLFLAFVQEVVIVSVESRHCFGLWAQRTPALLGMQGPSWIVAGGRGQIEI